MIALAIGVFAATSAHADTVPWATTAPERDPAVGLLLIQASQADRQGDTATALALFTRIITENPTDTQVLERAYFRRGLLRYRNGDTVGAEADLGWILQNHPTCENGASAAMVCGRLALSRRNHSLAASHFRMVIERRAGARDDRHVPAAYWGWIRCAGDAGNPTRARSLCHEVIEKYPDSPEAAAAEAYLGSE